MISHIFQLQKLGLRKNWVKIRIFNLQQSQIQSNLTFLAFALVMGSSENSFQDPLHKNFHMLCGKKRKLKIKLTKI